MWGLVRSYFNNMQQQRVNEAFKQLLKDLRNYENYLFGQGKHLTTIEYLGNSIKELWPQLDQGQRQTIDQVVWDLSVSRNNYYLSNIVKGM